MCIAVGIIGATVVGGGLAAAGAESAANTQAGAAERAQNISQNQYQQTSELEAPFVQSGTSALAQLNYGLGTGPVPDQGAAPGITSGSLNQPFTASDMQQYSPAYQFQLQQGQQGVLNQDAASQGAESGSALKDLMSFNQNYANTAYNNAFNQYQTQQQNTYNRLSNIAGIGQAAAGQQVGAGTALAGQSAQSATNVGTAQAAGTVGAANALSGGLQSGALLNAIYGGGGQAGGFNAGALNTDLSGGQQYAMNPMTGLPAGGSL